MTNNSKLINHNRVFVIGIGMNHNGDIKNAIKLIDNAKNCGADAVKFQMRDLDNIYQSEIVNAHKGDLGTEYTFNLLKKFNLEDKDFGFYMTMQNAMYFFYVHPGQTQRQ